MIFLRQSQNLFHISLQWSQYLKTCFATGLREDVPVVDDPLSVVQPVDDHLVEDHPLRRRHQAVGKLDVGRRQRQRDARDAGSGRRDDDDGEENSVTHLWRLQLRFQHQL